MSKRNQKTNAAFFAGIERLAENYLREAFFQEHGETMDVWKRKYVNFGLPEQSAETQVRQMAERALEKKTKHQIQYSVQQMNSIQEAQRAGKKQEAENIKRRNENNAGAQTTEG